MLTEINMFERSGESKLVSMLSRTGVFLMEQHWWF